MVLNKSSEKREVWADGSKHADSLTIQRKQISSIAPGTQPLNFTFIPTLGTLPSQVLVGKDHNYKTKVVSCRKEEMSAKPEGASVTEKNKNTTSCIIPASYDRSSAEELFPGQGVSASHTQDLQRNDLFIAEFVLVMDSDEGEDEVMNKTNKALIFEEESYKTSGAQLQVVEKPIASLSEVTVNEICIPEAQPNELSQDVNCEEKDLELYRIKPNYKVFAAIPTNKLLLDQKALDEPETNEENPQFDETTETRSEVYSPALLRQQTEEVCAVIDEVLHDPLPLHCDSSRSTKARWDSKRFNESSQMPKSSSGSAGRETKYAFLQSRKNAVIDCQETKPGVIRPLASKVTYTEKKDDDCSSNPFSHFTSSRTDFDDARSKKRTHQHTDL
eukprot:XP_017949920.1 PREDICTED: muscular LMNA-interacting protein isoform X2 [Xenopus tropicalis]